MDLFKELSQELEDPDFHPRYKKIDKHTYLVFLNDSEDSWIGTVTKTKYSWYAHIPENLGNTSQSSFVGSAPTRNQASQLLL